MLNKKTTAIIGIFLLTTFGLSAGELSKDQTSASIDEPSVRNSFGHLDIGLGPFPLPLPSFAAGYRNQWNHHGLDVYLSALTVYWATQVKGNAIYNYYFNPKLAAQFYVGGGVGVSTIFLSKTSFKKPVLCISPEFIFGKEYRSETGGQRFFQMQVSVPTIGTHYLNKKSSINPYTLYYPLVVFTYGIGF